MGNKVAIDEEMFLNVVDQMRITIPQEIKHAKDIQVERDKYVAQAHEEARRILAQAREDVAKLLDEHELRKAAQAQADKIVKQAQQEAERVRQGADEYAESKLKELSRQVGQLQAIIKNGLDALERRRNQAQEKAQAQKQTGVAATPPAPNP